MAGVAPQDGEPLTFTLAWAFHVGTFEIDTETRNTIMGLSAEVCETFIRDCINAKQLHRMAAAIEARLAALDAKAKAKAAKRPKASK
jgi:hypothetical protein